SRPVRGKVTAGFGSGGGVGAACRSTGGGDAWTVVLGATMSTGAHAARVNADATQRATSPADLTLIISRSLRRGLRLPHAATPTCRGSAAGTFRGAGWRGGRNSGSHVGVQRRPARGSHWARR